MAEVSMRDGPKLVGYRSDGSGRWFLYEPTYFEDAGEVEVPPWLKVWVDARAVAGACLKLSVQAGGERMARQVVFCRDGKRIVEFCVKRMEEWLSERALTFLEGKR